MAELIWLEYFNEQLYQYGMITEQERNRMKVKIEMKYENGRKGKQTADRAR